MHPADSPDNPAVDIPAVGIVVLNLHRRNDTIECLRSLAALSYARVFVVLIDNGCADFSAEEVAGLLPSARYLRTGRNLGFAGGVNLGMRHILAAEVGYVLLLNNDATIEPDGVTALVRAAASDPTIGIVGAKLLQRDAPGRLESAGVRVNLAWGRVYQIGFGERDAGQYDGTTDVSAVSGGAMLLTRVACERLGDFDERYFSYLEDVDFCLRAKRAGLRVVFAANARVHHKGKGSSGGHTSPRVLYYATRNHLLLMRDHGTGGGVRRPLRAAVIIALNLAYALREPGQRLSRLHAVWRALRDYQRGAVGAVAADAFESARR